MKYLLSVGLVVFASFLCRLVIFSSGGKFWPEPIRAAAAGISYTVRYTVWKWVTRGWGNN